MSVAVPVFCGAVDRVDFPASAEFAAAMEGREQCSLAEGPPQEAVGYVAVDVILGEVVVLDDTEVAVRLSSKEPFNHLGSFSAH